MEGQGRKGKNNEEQGRTGTNREEQRSTIKNRDGHGSTRKNREGHGSTGNDKEEQRRTGKYNEEQGRTGKYMAGQGRTGKDRCRTVSNSHYRSHTAPLFAKHNILTVDDMYTIELGVFMYKYSINDLPQSFNTYFVKRSEIHDYQTRHVDNLNLTKNKRTFSDRSVRSSGPVLWNSLDKSLKSSNSTKHFRNQFKQQLISEYV